MENIIKETIEVGLTEKSIKIPLRVAMFANNVEDGFEYNLSIDELGQVLVTPKTTESEFKTVEIYDDYSEEEVIDASITSCDESGLCSKEFVLVLDATMLCESESCSYTTIIDEIGQIVIQPIKKEDSFITVAEQGSLDLVTEDFQLTEYLGYTLRNTGDGWDIIDSNKEVVEEGIATLPEAKLFVCKLEIRKLTEELGEKEMPEIEAEVIEESVEPEWAEYAELCALTDNFTVEEGTIECDSEEEQEMCEKYIGEHYPSVLSRSVGNKFIVSFSKSLTEEFSEFDIIDKVMKGDITVFVGEGDPLDSYIPLTKLNSEELSYYYDPESGAVISYEVNK